MESLPEVIDTIIGTETIPSVNARDLHHGLGIRRDFSAWLKQHIEPDKTGHCDWIENKDFAVLLTLDGEQTRGGHNRIDYAFSIEMAEHIAMMTRTKKGREVRNYFRKARDQRNQLLASRTRVPVVQDPNIQMIIDLAVRQDDLQQRQAKAELEVQAAKDMAYEALHGQLWMTLDQYIFTHDLIRHLPPGTQRQQCGAYLTGICTQKNIPIYKQQGVKWQEWTYPVSILREYVPLWLTGQVRQLTLGKKNGRKQV